jgi:hypothetical protein
MSMSQPIRIPLQQSIIPLTPFPLFIFPTQVHHLCSSQYDGYDQCAETDRIPKRIFGRLALEVDESTDKGRAIRDGDNHAYTYCSNVMRREIV